MNENKPDFVLSIIDEFTKEVDLLSQNKEFMNFLEERSKSKNGISLEDARKNLKISYRTQTKEDIK